MAPKSIDEAKVTFSILDPLHVKLEGLGTFGVMNGKVSLLKKEVKVLFPVAKDIKTFKKFLKKDPKEGWYYETNY